MYNQSQIYYLNNKSFVYNNNTNLNLTNIMEKIVNKMISHWATIQTSPKYSIIRNNQFNLKMMWKFLWRREKNNNVTLILVRKDFLKE